MLIIEVAFVACLVAVATTLICVATTSRARKGWQRHLRHKRRRAAQRGGP